MAAARRLLIVHCHRCGHAVERVRRTTDQRTLDQLHASARCGSCHARAGDGALDLALKADPPLTALNARPGSILEPDGEFRPYAGRRMGRYVSTPKLAIVQLLTSGSTAPLSTERKPKPAQSKSQTSSATSACAIALVVAGGCAAILLSIVGAPVAGFTGDRIFHLVTSPGARERTYDFQDPLEREAYCFGREYLIHVRGADVPENVRELRRSVIRHCPELAARR